VSLAVLDVTDETATLTLNRPDKRNALSQALLDAIRKRLDEAKDQRVRALLVTAEGPTFSAGGDVDWMQQRVNDPSATRQAIDDHLNPVIDDVAGFPAPTVAGVHGAAIGAGLGLALACDVTIAAEDTVLGATQASLGLTPDAGTSWQLTRALGPKRALDLILDARTFSGEQAAEWGLVTQAVPADEVHDQARARARKLATGPTQALRTARQLVRDATEASLVEMLDREAATQEAMYRTEDQTEGVEAFLEDRDPEFTGR
jgi:enoyl-CoA hydratase/carnithine racemase